MIKKLACVTVLTAALLASAATAEATPRPAPPTGVPGAALLDGILGSLEIGHPATSLRTILPTGVRGR
ncbi:hypothetical protein C3492_07205 [Streptomyces sp. Ru62]|uniref:hypothetical protein n=1 Tax=Streptomyces sp. Ru62 TaxID=2080745 RepID=UPI000CDCFCA7|nr:hypothetical protein [Streptomyces sp. Ru62]POX64153.1 hypothetical protein C3492_07205 [Streptomyces sp. Ru62]